MLMGGSIGSLGQGGIKEVFLEEVLADSSEISMK